MKFARRLPVIIGLILALSVTDAVAQQGRYQLGEVLGLRYFELTSGDPDLYEQWVKERAYPFYDRNVPNVDWVVLKGDRGAREGEYAWFLNFTTLEHRNNYFPQEHGPFAKWEALVDVFNAEVGEDGVGPFESETEEVGDYVLIGAEQIKEMPWIDLLGIHHLRVRPGEEEAFEQFVTEEWNPKAHLLGTWVLIYRADRGPRTGEYALIFAFEERSLRDTYFPAPGEVSEVGQYVWGAVEKPWEEMQAYLEESPESEYTDFVLIR